VLALTLAPFSFPLQPARQSLIPNPMDDLDQLVRRVDEDRWLASRFAAADVRSRLIAVYALNYELARVADAVTTPAAGDIRFAWWRDALDEIIGGVVVRAHPVLQAFARAHAQTPFKHDALNALIEARARELDAQPFATLAERETYVGGTAGATARLAVVAAGGGEATEELARQAGLAWGYTGLLRAEAAWSARGWRVLIGDETKADLAERALGAQQSVRALGKMPAPLMPALGYVALSPTYVRAVMRGAGALSLFSRQLKLVQTAASGCL